MSITDPLIGKRLGDYLIEGLLGTGGMAKVYRGYDDNLDRYAAIKVIEPQLIASAEEDEYRERFLREARAIARLNHPNIVGVYQFNQIGNLYYIAMEYVEGRNLRDVLKSYIKQDKLMPTVEMLLVLRDIASALDYAHAQSIIHRDIKPSNILVKEDGHAILTDFGLALNAVEGTIGNTFGSVHYIAPEQAISSAQAVAQSDQYSLAIVTYELLTGRVPFDDASAMSVALKHISDPPPPPTELNPNIPAEVEQVVLKSLDKDVAKRFETSIEYINALELAFSMVENQDIEPAPGSLPSGPPPATLAVPPPERDADVATLNLNAASGASEPSRKTGSLVDSITAAIPQRNLMFIGVIVIIALLIVIGLFARTMATQSAEATATAQTATQVMVAQIAEETATAVIQMQTDDASTAIFIAEQSQTADALILAEETRIARTTVTAQALATDEAQTEAATHTSEALSIQQTESALATATQMSLPSATPSPTATASSTPTLEPTNTPLTSPTPSNTPRPTRTPTPELFIGEDNDSDSRQVLLRYDGRLLIVSNRDSVGSIDVSDLVLVRFEPDENDAMQITETLELRDVFGGQTDFLPPGRCLEILDNQEFRGLPTDNPLAENLCVGNPFWVTTTSTFWVSPNTQSYFEVRLGPVDVLTRCATNTPLTRREIRCAIDLKLP